MFGIGFGEIFVIGLVALLAMGPKELLTSLRQLGRFMGQLRRLAHEFRWQLDRAIPPEDRAEDRGATPRPTSPRPREEPPR